MKTFLILISIINLTLASTSFAQTNETAAAENKLSYSTDDPKVGDDEADDRSTAAMMNCPEDASGQRRCNTALSSGTVPQSPLQIKRRVDGLVSNAAQPATGTSKDGSN